MRETPAVLYDRPIRTALWDHLARLDGAALRLHELRLGLYAATADVATVGTRLDGYEIKSDRDNLDRLDEQVAAYSQVFEHVTVVCTDRHRDVIEARVPAWYGLLCASEHRAELRFVVHRSATRNPAIESGGFVGLLNRAELLRIARVHGVGRLGKTAWELRDRLRSVFSFAELSFLTREILRARAWTPHQLGLDAGAADRFRRSQSPPRIWLDATDAWWTWPSASQNHDCARSAPPRATCSIRSSPQQPRSGANSASSVQALAMR